MDLEEPNKPWNRVWTTEEMRNHRQNWSLACDTGLLKHLQNFSQNLTNRANETRDTLDSMMTKLNKTAITVQNITNESLALANTQFIENLLQEDSIETDNGDYSTEKIPQNLNVSDLLADVCESIKEGLSIMDEKYEKVEIVASDSEDEDDNTFQSIILKAKDPYQDRPLPYVIGSEKWLNSDKIGLESSSSESELGDDDDISVNSDLEENKLKNAVNSKPHLEFPTTRQLSASDDSDEFNTENSSISNSNMNKPPLISQNISNDGLEPALPTTVESKPKNTNVAPISFAEELAKRLENKEVNIEKPHNHTPSKNILPTDPTAWKNQNPYQMKKNIIPADFDVPPPINTISSAPKSNIDDLFGDAEDSDDSDDIFSNKPVLINTPSEQTNKNVNSESIQKSINDKKKYMDDGDIFENKDSDDLFGNVTKSTEEFSDTFQSTVGIKKKPVGGVSIFGNISEDSSDKLQKSLSTSKENTIQAKNLSSSNEKEASEGTEPIFKSTESSSISNDSSENKSIQQTESNATSRISLRSDLQEEDEFIPETDSIFGPPPLTKSSNKVVSLFDDNSDDNSSDDDLFGSKQTKLSDDNLTKQKFTNLFKDTDEDSDLFGTIKNDDIFSSNIKNDKPKINLFDDDDDDDDNSDIFASPSKNLLKNSSNNEIKTTKQPNNLFSEQLKNKLPTSIFDDSDEDDSDDLFGKSFSNKNTNLLSDDKFLKNTIEENMNSVKNDKFLSDDKKKSILDDDDNDDDLFSEKKKIIDKSAELKESDEKMPKIESKEPESIKDNKSDKSDTDGICPSSLSHTKKDPPKTLDLQSTTTMPLLSDDATKLHKKAVSGKIQGLLGKIGDLKILSPTDSPPVFKKLNEDKDNENEQEIVEKKSSSHSTPTFASGESSPPTLSTQSKTKESPSSKSEFTETAVSFDEPAQVETLDSIKASKSRPRIVKRRPQSRYARQIAIRNSTIDFDTTDATEPDKTEESIENNKNVDEDSVVEKSSDQEISKTIKDTSQSLDVDKSEVSVSKEDVNLNVNKSTSLLSPSTDEDDLFDVPPELPDDFAKDDLLFSKTPVLSSAEKQAVSKEKEKSEAKSEKSSNNDVFDDKSLTTKKTGEKIIENKSKKVESDLTKNESSKLAEEKPKTAKEPLPEKSKTLIFDDEDEDLFSKKSIKNNDKKSVTNIFDDDDDDDDLFAKSTTTKNIFKETTKNLFDDEDDNLFGSSTKSSSVKEDLTFLQKDKNTEIEKKDVSPPVSSKTTEDKTENISKQTPSKSSSIKDIFDDSSSDEDIFKSKKLIPKTTTKPKLFEDTEEENTDSDIFGNTQSSPSTIKKTSETTPIKKVVTKNLKETAEKIVEDPLSLLQDD